MTSAKSAETAVGPPTKTRTPSSAAAGITVLSQGVEQLGCGGVLRRALGKDVGGCDAAAELARRAHAGNAVGTPRPH